MWSKLKCWLGFHDIHEEFIGTGKAWGRKCSIYNRYCVRCPKQFGMMYTTKLKK